MTPEKVLKEKIARMDATMKDFKDRRICSCGKRCYDK